MKKSTIILLIIFFIAILVVSFSEELSRSAKHIKMWLSGGLTIVGLGIWFLAEILLSGGWGSKEKIQRLDQETKDRLAKLDEDIDEELIRQSLEAKEEESPPESL